MKWCFAWIGLLILGSMPARAQTEAQLDSITRRLNQRLQQEGISPLMRVVQVRELIAAELRRDEVGRVPLLLEYLARTTPDSITRFHPHEKWALLATTGDFVEMLKRIAADRWYYARQGPRNYTRPLQDGLFKSTQAYVARHADALCAQARKLRFLPEDSTFLQLAIQVMALQRDEVPQALTTELQAFADQYPQSDYIHFLGGLIRPELVPSRFSYGLDFHTGTAVFTRGLNQAFRPGFNMGHGFEFSWDQYTLYLRNYIGFATVRESYSYDGRTWEGGQRLNYYLPEISVGYRLLDTKRLRLSPFLGVSWCSFSPPPGLVKDNPAIDFDITMRGLLLLGMNLDVLLWKTQSGNEVGSWMLKLRGGMRANEAPLNPATEGTLYYLDVGIGGFGRKVRPPKPQSAYR